LKFEGFWFRLEPVKEFRLAGTVIKYYRYNYLEMKVCTYTKLLASFPV